MKLAGIRAMLPIAFAALALAASGCDKAKELAEEAAGIKVLEDADKQSLLAKVGWDETKNPGLAVFKVHKAIEITDKFKGDLGKTVELPVPVDAPDQGKDTAEKQRSLAIAKVESFKLDDTTQYTRLRIVSIARVDAENSQIVIDGEKINQYIPANKQINLANGQAGQYLLIEGKGEKGLAYLTGDVKLIADGKAEADATAVPGETFVFTSSSPFVTVAGDEASGGKYFLAMLEGSTGTVFGYNKSIGTVALGTPTTVTKEMAYSGVLDQYKEAVDGKVGKLGNAEASTKSTELFTKANKVVTDFVNGWKLVVTDLRFKQPPQAQPEPPKPATPPTPAPATPSAGDPVEVPPATDSPVVRKPAGEVIYNVDLGCSGFDPEKEGASFEMVRDGTKFENYEANPGWRATGDVRYAYEDSLAIFPDPASANYLDGVPGYCLLTTGDQAFATSQEPAYQPGPNGAGQVSEMFQKVNVPTEAKSIQIRVAFFSSEFPTYVGSSFNDSFFVKFDESVDMLAFGSLNDLAGGADAASACPSISAYAGNEDKKCGEWGFTADALTDGSEFWDVQSSSSMPAQGATFGCLAKDAIGTKCYHGMIPSRIICKDLTADDIGKIRTLRFNVADAGDAYYDSALAVDSVVFSTKACNEPAGRMTPESDSKARTVN